MSSAVNHMKRSHRSSGRARAAFGNMARTAYIRTNDNYSGKGLAAMLGLFHRRILESRKPLPTEAGSEKAE